MNNNMSGPVTNIVCSLKWLALSVISLVIGAMGKPASEHAPAPAPVLALAPAKPHLSIFLNSSHLNQMNLQNHLTPENWIKH